MNERLIITMEVENLPDNANVVDFQIAVMQNGWLSRIFKDWKKITYHRAIVKNMVVEKSNEQDSSTTKTSRK